MKRLRSRFINLKNYIMSDKSRKSQKIWLAIGAAVLIILLIIWLTVADLAGDTDVAAFVPPYHF